MAQASRVTAWTGEPTDTDASASTTEELLKSGLKIIVKKCLGRVDRAF